MSFTMPRCLIPRRRHLVTDQRASCQMSEATERRKSEVVPSGDEDQPRKRKWQPAIYPSSGDELLCQAHRKGRRRKSGPGSREVENLLQQDYEFGHESNEDSTLEDVDVARSTSNTYGACQTQLTCSNGDTEHAFSTSQPTTRACQGLMRVGFPGGGYVPYTPAITRSTVNGPMSNGPAINGHPLATFYYERHPSNDYPANNWRKNMQRLLTDTSRADTVVHSSEQAATDVRRLPGVCIDLSLSSKHEHCSNCSELLSKSIRNKLDTANRALEHQRGRCATLEHRNRGLYEALQTAHMAWRQCYQREAEIKHELARNIHGISSSDRGALTVSLDQLKEIFSCQICHEILYQPLTLSCLHRFCGHCLKMYFTRQRTDAMELKLVFYTCPICRGRVRDAQNNPSTNYWLDLISERFEDLRRSEEEIANIAELYQKSENILPCLTGRGTLPFDLTHEDIERVQSSQESREWRASILEESRNRDPPNAFVISEPSIRQPGQPLRRLELRVMLVERANDLEDPAHAIVTTVVTAGLPHIPSNAALVLPFDLGVQIEPLLTSDTRTTSADREASGAANITNI